MVLSCVDVVHKNINSQLPCRRWKCSLSFVQLKNNGELLPCCVCPPPELQQQNWKKHNDQLWCMVVSSIFLDLSQRDGRRLVFHTLARMNRALNTYSGS